jgi:hypothetical protein
MGSLVLLVLSALLHGILYLDPDGQIMVDAEIKGTYATNEPFYFSPRSTRPGHILFVGHFFYLDVC